MTRTLRIRYAGGVGSAVFVEVGGTPFILTAGHLVSGVQAGDSILVRFGPEWVRAPIAHRIFGPDGCDVALLVPQNNLGEPLPEERLDSTLIVGSEVAYCGFPLGLEGRGVDEDILPTPLVKGAIFSGALGRDDQTEFLFDTVNNVGFSGGPVMSYRQGTRELRVAATIFGYRYDAALPVLRRHPDGSMTEDPDYFVRPNSGFMRAVPISTTLRLARAFNGARA